MGGSTLTFKDLAQSSAPSTADRLHLLQAVGEALVASEQPSQAIQAVATLLVPALAQNSILEWARGTTTVGGDLTLSVDRVQQIDGDEQARLTRERQRTETTERTEQRSTQASELIVPIEGDHGVIARIHLSRVGMPFDDQDRLIAELIAWMCRFFIADSNARDIADEARRARDKALGVLDAILSESPLALAFFDSELRFHRVNSAFAEISGIPEHEHIGRHLVEAVPHVGSLIEPALRETVEGRSTPHEQELSVGVPDDADSRHLVAHYYPLRDSTGSIVGAGTVLLDVTERQRADEARQRSESQLRLALDATRMGLWFWDLQSNELRWSETNALLLGIDPLSPASLEALSGAIHPEDRDRVLESIDRTNLTGEPFEESFRVVWPDGSEHWILAKGQAQFEDGQIVEMAGIQLDVTESRAAQDERARLALRQARAGEQAVRMQRVTAALSEAVTVSQVCDVILHEGCAVVEAPRGVVALLSDDRQVIETVRMFGYEEHANDTVELEPQQQTPLSDSLLEGKTVLLTDVDDITSSYPETASTIAASGARAVASLPLGAQGAWMLTWPEDRQFQEGEIIILLTLAAQASQALDRARMYERERLIATALQRTLLPDRLPAISGATTARRYLPSAAGVEVGGDWYDVLRFPDNRVAIVIGDVGGHNMDSAATMGQLRNAVRSYAWEGHPPSTVLEATNRLLCGLEPGVLATCCYVELNLDDGIAAVARAGHPPPLLIGADAAQFTDIPADPPLGTEVQQKFEQSTIFLSSGDTLVLFTDGLIETRSVSVGQGMQRLLAAAESISQSERDGRRDIDAEKVAELLLQTMPQTREREDDVAILVLRYEPTHSNAAHAGPRIIRRHLPSSAASAGVARRFAADVMTDWGAPELADLVSLCISELVTNALIHTATDVELVLRLSPSSVRVEVIDHSDRMPIVRKSTNDDTSGRGLHIVDAIASDWGVEPHRSGKSVWFRIDR